MEPSPTATSPASFDLPELDLDEILKNFSTDEQLFSTSSSLPFDNSPSLPLDYSPFGMEMSEPKNDAAFTTLSPSSSNSFEPAQLQLPTDSVLSLPMKRKVNTEDSPAKKSKSTKTETRNKVEPVDEKHMKRLIANKKSAQASRQRKKQLKSELEEKYEDYTKDHERLKQEVTALEAENRVLKNEFLLVQKMINESPFLTKFMMAQLMGLLQNHPQALRISPPAASGNPQMASVVCLMMVLHSFGPFFKQVRDEEMLAATASKIAPQWVV